MLAAVSALLRLVTLDKSVHLWAHLTVGLSLCLATARTFFQAPLFRAAAFVLLALGFSLTEMALAAPIVLGLLRNVTDPRPSERWLAFALPIVRIDLACVPLVMALGLAARDRKRAATLLAATALGIAVQLLVMKLAFGHFVSVAALLKATNSLVSLADNVATNLAGSAFQAGLFAAHALFAGLALALRRDRVMVILVGASLSFLAMHTVLSVLRGWYLLPSAVAVLFTLEHAMQTERAPRSLVRVARASVALLAFAFLVRGIRAEIVYAGDQRVAATFISELRARVPSGTRLYTWDNPGFLGYFSGFAVVDGDGLVNDYAYARRIRDGTLAGYLDEERICHVIVADADDDPLLDVSGLVLRRADVELLYVIRRKVSSQSDFALYRIDSERCAER